MPSGTEVAIGLAQGGAWGTPVVLGAGHKRYIKSESLGYSVEEHIDDSAGQGVFPTGFDTGLIDVKGGIDTYFRYETMSLLLALVMGSASVAQVDTSAAYDHTLNFADSLSGIFATMAIENGLYVAEMASLKLTGFEIKSQRGSPLSISFNGIANDKAHNTSSGTNNLTTMASLAFPAGVNLQRVLQQHMVMRLNDQSGAALSSGDIIRPTDWSLKVERPHDAFAEGENVNMSEPEPSNQMPTVTLDMNFARLEHDNNFQALKAGTPKKMDLVFTGPEIEAGYYYSWSFEFPHLRVSKSTGDNVDGANRLTDSVTLQALGVPAGGSAPSGMTTTNPFMATNRNTLTAALLS